MPGTAGPGRRAPEQQMYGEQVRDCCVQAMLSQSCALTKHTALQPNSVSWRTNLPHNVAYSYSHPCPTSQLYHVPHEVSPRLLHTQCLQLWSALDIMPAIWLPMPVIALLSVCCMTLHTYSHWTAITKSHSAWTCHKQAYLNLNCT